ncbi:MAG TPA: DUF2946 family protein [Dongiaceae bacterium]|jgi:hypothetical protein
MVPTTRRIVAWVGALAVLSYALTAGPIMLRMAAAHSAGPTEQVTSAPCPMHASHAQHKHPAGQNSLNDHQHCLFCQGGVCPGLIVAPAALVGPSLQLPTFVITGPSALAIEHPDAGYASRAPPRLT